MKKFICALFLFFTLASTAHPLCFTENRGQVRDQYKNARTDIDYVLHDNGLDVFIGKGELHYQFSKATDNAGTGTELEESHFDSYRMDVELLGANKSAEVVAEEKQAYYERYYTSGSQQHSTIAHTWKKLTYRDIYPHIDWVIYVKNEQAEYEFIVHEGGNTADIRLRYSGAASLELKPDGSLEARTPMGGITEAAPYSYERSNNRTVNSSFLLRDNIVSFDVGAYTGTLIIDPALIWGTYYGGSLNDNVRSVAADSAGYVYIAGLTASANNIATTGGYQQTNTGINNNAFLVKFDTAGTRIWGTYFGGNINEAASDVSVDSFGNIYIVGTAASPGMATVGAYQEIFGGAPQDGLLVKFDSSGALLWSTYFGGEEFDYIFSVANDNVGNVFVAGGTNSTTGIAGTGSFQPVAGGSGDGFLAKFDAAGVLQWSTYYGGASNDGSHDICTDGNGNVYMSGITSSATNIATAGSHQPAPANSSNDHFLVKFNGQGQRLWGTYYGGSEDEDGSGIAFDGLGHIYLAGYTASDTGIATAGSHQPNLSTPSVMDMYVARFSEDGVRLWATYYGGAGVEGSYSTQGNAVTCDHSGNVFITGNTTSDTGIATTCVHQEAWAGLNDLFLAKLDSSGVRLWGTYYGGTGNDGFAFCTWFDGCIYLGGTSAGTNGIATPGSHSEVYNGGFGDGCLARFSDCDIPVQSAGITGDIIACQYDTVTYIADPVCNATSYTWTLPSGWSGSSVTNTITVVAAGGSGSISVTANSACGDGPAQILAVTVQPAPVPVITGNGNLLSTGMYSSYQWYLNGVLITGATSQAYLAAQNGQYTVVVTDGNGCKGTSVALPLGVSQVAGNSGIAVYPNPAGDDLYVYGVVEKTSYRLLNITGTVAKEGMLQKGSAVISIAQCAPGVYILETGNGQKLKLLKN